MAHRCDSLAAITALAITTLTLSASAQSQELWDRMKQAFPDAPAVYIERSHVLTLRIEGDSLKAFTDVTEDVMHLKENTESMTSNRVYGSSFSEISGLEAKTLVWEKNRYREAAVGKYRKNSDRDQGVFYDDGYYYSFDFPSVASRNRTVVKYRENHKDPRFVVGYLFGTYLPQATTSYVIKSSKDIDLHYEVLNDPDKKVRFEKKEKGNNVTYTWTSDNVAGLRRQGDAPSFRYFVPHVVIYVKSFQTKNGKKDVLPDLNALYAWYWTHLSGLKTDPGPDLPGIVAKLKSESTSEDDLVRRIFYWVEDHIHYVAFEQGMRGLIPNNGAYTCEKKYGDCKDMANLIVEMIRMAGLKAYHTWIGTRDLPYKYSSFPSPLVDNHMIATYVSQSGEYVYLDATGKYIPKGFPTDMIQGKEALIAKGPTNYEIRTIPEYGPDRSAISDSMTIKLNGTQVVGIGKVRLTGFVKIQGDMQMDEADEESVKNRVSRIVGKGSNKFILDRYEIANRADRDVPTRITYDFNIMDYAQKAGSDIFINLNLGRDYYSAFVNAATRYNAPMERDFNYTEIHYVEMEIPEGFEVESLPANASNKGKFISFGITYGRTGNRVIVSKTLTTNCLLLEHTSFEDWNKDIRALTETYKESLMLRKK